VEDSCLDRVTSHPMLCESWSCWRRYTTMVLPKRCRVGDAVVYISSRMHPIQWGNDVGESLGQLTAGSRAPIAGDNQRCNMTSRQVHATSTLPPSWLGGSIAHRTLPAVRRNAGHSGVRALVSNHYLPQLYVRLGIAIIESLINIWTLLSRMGFVIDCDRSFMLQLTV
jgi:hypothetical protein